MQREQAVSGGGPMLHTGIQLGTHGTQVRTDDGGVMGRPCMPSDSQPQSWVSGLALRAHSRNRLTSALTYPTKSKSLLSN